MIDIFKSPTGKRIIAIDEDSGISAIHAVGRIMLIGTDEAMDQLRIALSGEQKAKLRPLTDVEKSEIMRLHSEGLKPSDIGHRLGLNSRQVSGFVQGHVHPVRVNMTKKATSMSDEEKIDKIVADGRKAGHGFVQIADDINRIVGGHWLPDHVSVRLKELRPNNGKI